MHAKNCLLLMFHCLPSHQPPNRTLQKPNIKILRGLEVNSEILERIARSFGQVLATGCIKVHSFREEIDTKGLEIVEDFSSTISYFHKTRGTLHANHRNMTKFSSPGDVKFQRVVSVLRRWLDDIPSSQPISDIAMQSVTEAPSLPDGLVFDERYQDCLTSLNYAEARNRIEVETAHEETYDWVFDRQLDFYDWLEGKHPNNIIGFVESQAQGNLR